MITIRNDNFFLSVNTIISGPNKRYYYLLQDFRVPYLYWGVDGVL